MLVFSSSDFFQRDIKAINKRHEHTNTTSNCLLAKTIKTVCC